jgi:hypothetical protein
VQEILRAAGNPELPEGEIPFRLTVKGKAPWSWDDIRNNGAETDPHVNPQNGMADEGEPVGQAPVDLIKGKVYLIKEDGPDGYVGRGIMQDPNPAGYGKGFYGFALLDSPDDCRYGVFSSKDVIDATGCPDVEAAERSGGKFSVDPENPVTGGICHREFTL